MEHLFIFENTPEHLHLMVTTIEVLWNDKLQRLTNQRFMKDYLDKNHYSSLFHYVH